MADFLRMIPDHTRYALDDRGAIEMRFTAPLSFAAPATAAGPLAPSPTATTPAPAALRALLGKVLRDATDFDAFCFDHFPDVHRRFSDGMNRVARETLLLQHVDHGELHARLTQR